VTGTRANEEPAPRFFLLLMALTAIALAIVLRPVLADLLLAACVAAVTWPLQEWLCKKLRGRRGVSAGVLTLGVILLVVGPIATLLAMVVRDADDGVRFLVETAKSEPVQDLLGRLPDGVRRAIDDGVAALPRDAGEAFGQVGENKAQVAGAVGATLAATGSLLFHGALFLIALFFMLVHGDELVGWLDGVSPLRRGQTRELLATFKKVSYGVVVATVLTAAVQAIAALIGYYIASVPNPVFFAAGTFFMAFVPAIGAGAVAVLAAALLFVTGHTNMAIFLTAWGVIVVGLSDNVVRPLLTRRGIEIHGAILFFALLGGLAAFGAMGLLIGPLVISLFLALLRMYHRDYSPEKAATPAMPGLPEGEPASD
jgi:predicted PurR-regulated permease PerM